MPEPDVVPWRGYINQILFGTELRAPLSDQLLARLVDALLQQKYFNSPVDDYYRAAERALNSGEPLAIDSSQDEGAARDLFVRLLPALDKRRPWPEPAFRKVDICDWSESLQQPLAGQIALTVKQTEHILHRNFRAFEFNGVELAALTLQLRSRVQLSLFGRRKFNQARIDLRTDADPAATISEFTEATGIDVSPPSTDSSPVPKLDDAQ